MHTVFSFKSVKNLLSSKQDTHVLDPELAQSYRKLERLSGTVDVLQKNVARFMELGIKLTEAGLTLANDVSEFYSSSDLDSRQKSVRGFVECQSANHNKSNEELTANLSGQGALAEFSTWSEELAIAKSKVNECQRVKDDETLAARRLVSLREQLRKKRDKTETSPRQRFAKGGLFAFGATHNEIIEIEQKILKLESEHRQLTQKASSLKIEVDEITERIVANRFDTFDAIFTSLMEIQMDFYSRCSGEARKLERWINSYRRLYPKPRRSSLNTYEELPSKSSRHPSSSQVEKGATTPEPEIVAGGSGAESGEIDTIIVDMDIKEDVKEEQASDVGLDLSRTVPTVQTSEQPDLTITYPRAEARSSEEYSFPCTLNDIPSTKDLLGLVQTLPQRATSAPMEPAKKDVKSADTINPSPTKPLRLCLGLWWIDLSDTAASERGISLSVQDERKSPSFGTTGDLFPTELNSDPQPEMDSSKRANAETDIGTMDFLCMSPETKAAPSPSNVSNKQPWSCDFFNSLVSKKDSKSHIPTRPMNDQEIQPSLLDDVTHDDLNMFLDNPVPRASKVKVQRSDSHGHEIMRGFGKRGGPKRLKFSEREQKEIAVKMEQSKRDYDKRLAAERNLQIAFEAELSKVEAKLNKWEYMGEEGKQRRNIRNLLSTLHTVLWPETSWRPVAVSGLITKKKIKDAYRAAILEVHPDKHTKDPVEVQAVSSRTFEALNEAFNDFRKQNR